MNLRHLLISFRDIQMHLRCQKAMAEEGNKSGGYMLGMNIFPTLISFNGVILVIIIIPCYLMLIWISITISTSMLTRHIRPYISTFYTAALLSLSFIFR